MVFYGTFLPLGVGGIHWLSWGLFGEFGTFEGYFREFIYCDFTVQHLWVFVRLERLSSKAQAQSNLKFERDFYISVL